MAVIKCWADDARDNVVIQIEDAQRPLAYISLDSASVEKHIHDLARHRAQLKEEVPKELDPGSRLEALVAMVATKIATKRREDTLKKGSKIPDQQSYRTAQAAAAKTMNVGLRSVGHARVVQEHAVPELRSAVESGKVTVFDPVWRVPGKHPPQGKVLVLRHPGLGWLSFVLPHKEARSIAESLLKDLPPEEAA